MYVDDLVAVGESEKKAKTGNQISLAYSGKEASVT